MILNKSQKQLLKLEEAKCKLSITLKTNYSDKTTTKMMSIFNRILEVAKKEEIDFSTQEGMQKLRDETLKLKTLEGKNYVISTTKSNLNSIKICLETISHFDGFKNIIKESVLKELVLPNKYKNELKTYIATKNETIPFEIVERLINSCAKDNLLDLRALVLVIILAFSGIRNQAAKTLTIGSVVDCGNCIEVHQIPSQGIKTKNGKAIYSAIVVPDEKLLKYIRKYIAELKKLGFDEDSPLFPITKPMHGKDGAFDKGCSVFENKFAKSDTFLNKIIKKMLLSCDIEKTYTIHSFRHTFSRFIKPYLKGFEGFEACARSLGHNSTNLLMSTYGKLSTDECRKIMYEIQSDILAKGDNDAYNSLMQFETDIERLDGLNNKEAIKSMISSIKILIKDVRPKSV